MACNSMNSPSSFFPQNFLLQMQTPHEEHRHHSQLSPPIHALNFPSTAPRHNNHQEHIGIAAPMVLGKRSMSFSMIENTTSDHQEQNNNNNCEEELSDDGHGGEKKKRLNSDQVRTLEKNFELGNKLEPERKLQLAKALGLQPRQIAIWFQNRRARWKTRQLEKDYDVLKKQFDAIKAENETLHAQNKKLQTEIISLKGKDTSELINLNKETEGSCSNRSENSSEINLDMSRTSASVIDDHRQTLPVNNFFQSVRPADIEHLLQNSTRLENMQCPKLENGVTDQGHFSNLLCSMDDQAAFWNWSDQHNFH